MRIKFDQQLTRGIEAYEDVLGRWWFGQSSNEAHRRAYRRVANYIAASFQDSPGVIVDYACGVGNLLCRLANRFPHSRLIGLDGSSYLLTLAQRRLSREAQGTLVRVSFVRMVLPNFSLGLKANLVVFAFPNLVPGTARDLQGQVESRLAPEDSAAARAMAEGTDEVDCTHRELVQRRMVSQNLRGLLCKGGHCVRVEYASMRRDEMTRAELLRAAFEEGSSEADAAGRPRRPWFRVLASAYFRSGVIEDVYHQTKNARDRRGGYQITVLRAV